MRTKKKRTLGLYLHIPFCVRKCNYCDFLSFSSNEETKEQYVQALCKEIASFQKKQTDYVVTTIFFGGGTPSLLTVEQIQRIMKVIQESFFVHETAEITIEMNPGTVTTEKLIGYKQSGINRLSIGLQTTDDERLKVLGRIHTYEQFLNNYNTAREVGFDNISIDLMSALPKEDLLSYQKDVETILALEPEHISSYSLIIEEGTPFYDDEEILNLLPEEEEDRAMYELTERLLTEAGYHRYEISNYAKEGKESRHNCIYWTGGEYLGLGLGASSYILQDSSLLLEEEREMLPSSAESLRFRNTDSLQSYVNNSARSVLQREELSYQTKKDRIEETMFLGLRMINGVNQHEFFEMFGVEIETLYGEVIQKFIQLGVLQWKEEQLCFTKKGLDVSNSILCEFLLEDER